MEQLDLFGKAEIISGPEIPGPIEISKPQEEWQFDPAPAEQNPRELPAYTDFKRYLTPDSPFANCRTADDIERVWFLEWDKINHPADELKNRKTELNNQLKQYKGRGKETSVLREPIIVQIKAIDDELKSIVRESEHLEMQCVATQVNFTQKIVDNIFTFEPEFNLTEALESCWEIEDYENYLLSVVKSGTKSL